ncbi:LCP family protein [Caloramator australicus]|uniref:Cell envelope-associated transcriptional attenuator LytR-CpsA-Psr, subfamily M (As in PMID19099556) n=1 Tax=Caloramator australicus RC3 TaxID=857293 RepID=I7K7C2_9CLOT|nr:LCP family protein [Caloramator australicus]CCJ33424.1 Cell envelope-associated transcriptional attenuator LytR-CpsA-Psr, subfamily M (as in PMID19099556) [Caloramator australicus RC3]
MSNDDFKGTKLSYNEPVNVLVLGVDAGDYKNRKSSHTRSDTIMLVNYDPNENKAFILSIPRDTRVKINGDYCKINSAHSIGGAELTIKTIENFLNVHIDYYVEIDYEGFRRAIDAIGGVDVVIPRDMHYKSYDLDINFKKGEKVHLNGELAEKFIRWRKNNDGTGYATGDLGRISTQQEFLKLILMKLKTPEGIIRIPNLLNTVVRWTKTNVPPKLMVYYAYKAIGMHADSIESETLKGEPKYISGISYYIYDEDKNKEVLSYFKKDNDLIIIILNSTNVSGLAKKYKERLSQLGYKNIKTGNHSITYEKTEIQTSNLEIAHKIKEFLKIGEVNYLKDNKNEIIIILGTDAIK